MKKHNNSGKKSESTSKRTKSRGPVRRDPKGVLAELVAKLKHHFHGSAHARLHMFRSSRSG